MGFERSHNLPTKSPPNLEQYSSNSIGVSFKEEWENRVRVVYKGNPEIAKGRRQETFFGHGNPTMELAVQPILAAARQHDVPLLRKLLSGSTTGPANAQNPETGTTPLHAAIAGAASSSEEESAAAVDTVRLLLQSGGIWNELDGNGETPGCLARRLGLEELYGLMVDAGVRAEMLLSRLDEYERLADGSEMSNDPENSKDVEPTNDSEGRQVGDEQLPLESSSTTPSDKPPGNESLKKAGQQYLGSSLVFATDRLVDADKNAIMMEWERQIMGRTADLLAPTEGLRILNIGHGKLYESSRSHAKDLANAVFRSWDHRRLLQGQVTRRPSHRRGPSADPDQHAGIRLDGLRRDDPRGQMAGRGSEAGRARGRVRRRLLRHLRRGLQGPEAVLRRVRREPARGRREMGLLQRARSRSTGLLRCVRKGRRDGLAGGRLRRRVGKDRRARPGQLRDLGRVETALLEAGAIQASGRHIPGSLMDSFEPIEQR